MLKRSLKVAYSGMPGAINIDPRNELILRIIENATNTSIKIVSNFRESDLVLAYPYGSGAISFKLKWIFFQIVKKVFKIKECTNGLRWILGVGSRPSIFISHENLDRPYWWKTYGELVTSSNLPRLTYWPKEIDPNGARFPYWYNYIDWEKYPRNNFYSRFGRLYSIEALMSPLKQDFDRREEVILIASHLDFPRKSLLDNLLTTNSVAIFGRAGTKFVGGKLELMRKYKYAFCCENSVGFGYDSEKVPEAWMAGCIPCGVYLNPYSDFNPEILHFNNSKSDQVIYSSPLLLKKPNLEDIEDYIKQFISQYSIGDANI